jgi:hypothetical protein
LLAAAQFRRPVTASIAEAHGVEKLHCAPPIRSALREQRQNYVLEGRKLREQIVRLEDETDPVIAVARGSSAG